MLCFHSMRRSARTDPVAAAGVKRETATQRAKELIELMQDQHYAASGDAILDIQELQNNWLECLLETGKSFFYNTVSGESRWERPAELPLPEQAEKDFEYDKVLVCLTRYILIVYDKVLVCLT